jgi:hypothetical protein
MIDVDEYYKRIERAMVGEFKSTGKIENSFLQNVGKTMAAGDTKRGQMFTDMLANVERMMTGQKKHGYQQNKKTDVEKLIEKGAKNGTGN